MFSLVFWAVGYWTFSFFVPKKVGKYERDRVRRVGRAKLTASN